MQAPSPRPAASSAADSDARVAALEARRFRVGIALTLTMVVIYFGFIALVAFDRPLLATRIGSGLTLGILLGASVIVAAWLLTFAYVRWANVHYDAALDAIAAQASSPTHRP